MWRRMTADGCEWDVRVLADEVDHGPAGRSEPIEILEFRPLDGLRPPRRLATAPGALERMDDAALAAAFRQALPIGVDHYGRPGKRMQDGNQG